MAELVAPADGMWRAEPEDVGAVAHDEVCAVVHGVGGLVGVFVSDTARINDTLCRYNAAGYRLVRFSREARTNLADTIVQWLCLVGTLLVWSPSVAGLLFFRRPGGEADDELADPKEPSRIPVVVAAAAGLIFVLSAVWLVAETSDMPGGGPLSLFDRWQMTRNDPAVVDEELLAGTARNGIPFGLLFPEAIDSADSRVPSTRSSRDSRSISVDRVGVSQGLSPPPSMNDWRDALYSSTCELPCAGGIACPSKQKRCVSGLTCVPGRSREPLRETWMLHLSIIGEIGPNGEDVSPCNTHRDLWLCRAGGSQCVSQQDACQRVATAAMSSAGLPIQGDELTGDGFVLEVRDGGATGRSLGTTNPIRGLLRGGLCNGFIVGVTSAEVKAVSYFLLPE